jgi:hypothetical protein
MTPAGGKAVKSSALTIHLSPNHVQPTADGKSDAEPDGNLLTLSPDGLRPPGAAIEPPAVLQKGDDHYEMAGTVLTRVVNDAAKDKNFKVVQAELRSANPSRSAIDILACTRAWLVDKTLASFRERYNNKHEAQDVFMARVCALMEASLVERWAPVNYSDQIPGRSKPEPGIPLASPAQVRDRELDVNFASDLAAGLKAHLINGAISSMTDERHGAGRLRVREVVLAQVVLGELLASRSEALPTNQGATMRDGDSAVVMRFCEELHSRLTMGVEFSMSVWLHMRRNPGSPRELAQCGAALAIAKEVLEQVCPAARGRLSAAMNEALAREVAARGWELGSV